MAKYSTGGSSGGGGASCELCGREGDRLVAATVAGARLQVCEDCAPHDDAPRRQSSPDSEPSRRKKAARNAARAADVWANDSERWEREGTDYQDDPLPYLLPKYGERSVEARQEAGLTTDELADELGIPEDDVLAVEQGRANQARIGGSVIAAVEEHLGVTLSEE